MRVLGIDPGYAIVGWGVVEYISNRFAPIGYGAVITEKDTPFEQRLVEIYESVFDICKRYQPEALSIEKLYYQHNQTTVIGVAEARGVILLAASSGDHKAFTKAAGVGPKLAQRITLELKDKVGKGLAAGAGFSGNVAAPAPSSAPAQAVAALVSLGYAPSDAAAAVARVDETLSVQEIITIALRSLSRV